VKTHSPRLSTAVTSRDGRIVATVWRPIVFVLALRSCVALGQPCPSLELPSAAQVTQTGSTAGSTVLSFHFVAPSTGIYSIFVEPDTSSSCELSMSVRADSCDGPEIEERNFGGYSGNVWVPLEAGSGVVMLLTDGCPQPNPSRKFTLFINLVFEGRSVTSDFALPFHTFDFLQFSPDGGMAEVGYRGDFTGRQAILKLVYRTRHGTESWTEQVVAEKTVTATWAKPSSEVYDGWANWGGGIALLLYDPSGAPHVLLPGGSLLGSLSHWTSDGTNWRCVDSNCFIFTPDGEPDLDTSGLAAAFDQSGTLQVVTREYDLQHGTLGLDGWQWEVIDDELKHYGVFDPGPLDLYIEVPPRTLSLAIAPNGTAHVTYTREGYDLTCPSEDVCSPFSELRYATNESGSWVSEVVVSPPDRSGDGALGASIAIDSGGNPAIASIYVERAATGSAQYSNLRYYQRQLDGTWIYQIVADRADGYVGSDGSKFTGITPYLRFDGYGQPHILFSDLASSHFPGIGAVEFRGQIRHAYLDGKRWKLQTFYPQRNPLQLEMLDIGFALSPIEIAFTGTEVQNTLDHGAIVGSTFKVVDGVVPCPGGACGPTYTPSPVAAVSDTPAPTPTLGPCVGDCSHNGSVTVDELIRGVDIALGNLTLDQCPSFDCSEKGNVTIDCLVKAVNAALIGCSG